MKSESVEFKKSLIQLKQGVVSLVSMLNKFGEGKLYFGVLKSGEIVGVSIEKNTIHEISDEIKNHIRPKVVPTIETKDENGKTYIVVSVSGNEAPYSAYGRYYIRKEDDDFLMENQDFIDIFSKKSSNNYSFEDSLSDHSIESVDEVRVIKYFEEAVPYGRLPFTYKNLESALTNLGLYKENRLTNAGINLFSTLKPIKLKMAIFDSDSQVSFSDIRFFEGNMFDCIEEGMRYISSSIRWKKVTDEGKRQVIPEIPIEAIKEVLINSFVHMDMTLGVPNEILITPSTIAIKNPGSTSDLNPKDIADGKKGSNPKNPVSYMTLYKGGFVESIGGGFEKIFRLCAEAGIKVDLTIEKDSFSFSFHRQKDFLKKTKKDVKEEPQKPIFKGHGDPLLDLLERNPKATREEISKALKISSATVARKMKSLQNSNKISRIGGKKEGFWKIN